MLLANKGLRVDEEETGGTGGDFDPTQVLSNTKKESFVSKVIEPPIEEILMSRTLWPE
jgi:hypothetical protein